jgi:hypothetical protein
MENEIRKLHKLPKPLKFYFQRKYFDKWNKMKVETIKNFLYRGTIDNGSCDLMYIYHNFTSIISPHKNFPTLFTAFIKYFHPKHKPIIEITPMIIELAIDEYVVKIGKQRNVLINCIKELGFIKFCEEYKNGSSKEIYTLIV